LLEVHFIISRAGDALTPTHESTARGYVASHQARRVSSTVVRQACRSHGMTITLHHHPHSRAANVVWMLQELGVPYELHHVDLATGEQKKSDIVALNPMGKLPVLIDGDVVVSESAAIGLYLADRYSLGVLAPALDDPARGTYLRWSLFAPSVIEPGALAHAMQWQFKSSAAGWGDYTAMLDAIETAVTPGPFVLGERFSMADVIFGGTVRYMLRFKMLEPRPAFTAYVDRLSARPASLVAEAKNAESAKAHGLGG
jgi:glutathione S-transferase